MQMFLRDLATSAATPVEAIDAIIDAIGHQLEESEWTQGCPVATLALEMAPYSEEIQEMCAETFRGWEFVICSLLERAGMEEGPADDAATFILSAMEGSLILARTHRSLQPLENARKMLHRMLATLSEGNVSLAAAE